MLKIHRLLCADNAKNERDKVVKLLSTISSSEGRVALDLLECRFRSRFIFVMDSR